MPREATARPATPVSRGSAAASPERCSCPAARRRMLGAWQSASRPRQSQVSRAMGPLSAGASRRTRQ